MSGAIRSDQTDVLIDVRLTPRGGRDAIDGLQALSDGRPVIAARVRAVPEDGKANAALETLIAKWAGVPKSAVSVVHGATSRTKTLRLKGLDHDGLAALVARAESLKPSDA